jgi:hypothetical protein
VFDLAVGAAVLPALLLLAGGLLILMPGRGPVAAVGTEPRVRPEDLARGTGFALGVVLACWTSRSGTLGRGLMLAPTAFGAGAVLGVLGADALTPRPRGVVRTAGLTPRRIRDYLPARLTAVLTGFAAVLLVLLAVAAALGTADDLGRPGRVFRYACGGMDYSHSPWPGSYYGVPLAASLVAATAVCGLALRRLARRPAPGELDAKALDDRRRRAAATHVVAAWGLLVTGSLAGVGFFAEAAINVAPCANAGTRAASWVLLATVLGAAVTALLCLAVLCRSGARRP